MKKFNDIGLYLLNKLTSGQSLSDDDIMAYTNGDLFKLNILEKLINNLYDEIKYCEKNNKQISQRTIARWCCCGRAQIDAIEKRAIQQIRDTMERKRRKAR